MKKKTRSLNKVRSRYGRLFILPWEIGFVLFFLLPLGQSVLFSISKVSITVDGFKTDFLGLEKYRYILFSDPVYFSNIKSTVISFLFSMPIIVILSLILAMILSQKFRGRLIARAMFFLPVIIATGVVMNILNRNLSQAQMIDVQGAGNTYISGLIDFDRILTGLGFPASVTGLMGQYIAQIFDLIWNCGIQTVLFISGIQTIPDQLYEVSKVEGATKWEEFWFITFPMLAQVVVLVMIYTAVDLFMSNSNPVIDQIYNLLINQQNYDTSSAMLWMYFLIVGVLTGGMFWIVRRGLVKRWE